MVCGQGHRDEYFLLINLGKLHDRLMRIGTGKNHAKVLQTALVTV